MGGTRGANLGRLEHMLIQGDGNYPMVEPANEALAPMRDPFPNRIPKLASFSGDLMVEFV